MPEALPKRRYLDPRSEGEAREKPIADSVNIPLEDIPGRAAELPPKYETILVAGPEPLVRRAVEQLNVNGRGAQAAKGWRFGNNAGAGRLWEPNTWLTECLRNLEPGSAIDLGCGSGRDAVYLSAQGWDVQATDVLPDAIELGKNLAARYLADDSANQVDWQVADVLADSFQPTSAFELVFSAFLFDRNLTSRSLQWLKPGGVLVIEAFTTVHQTTHGKPASPDRVVRPGELAELLSDLEILRIVEGEHGGRHTARAWARRRVD